MYLDWSDPFQPGDQLRVEGPLFAHVGIYIGNGQVLHGPKGGTVGVDHISVFGGGRPVKLVSRVPAEQQDAAVERALSLIGQPYDALLANCEHVVTFAQTGEASSPTLRVLGAIAVVGGLLFAGSRG